MAQEANLPQLTDSIITYNELPTDGQRQAWNKMHDDWLKNYFSSCMVHNKVKLSCAHCSKVYLTVDFKIDSSGKVNNHRIVKDIMCGRPFTVQLKTCFLEFFLNAVFPEGLRNMILEVTLGNGLKC